MMSYRMRSRGATTIAFLVASCWAFAGPAEADPDPPPPPRTTIDHDGTYAVGTDIAPGTYSSAGPISGGACYWKRVSGSEIVDSALTKEPQVVQIEATDTAFKTDHCQPWQLIDCTSSCAPPARNPQDLLGDLRNFLAPRQGALPGGH